jgi:hypothetical protein
MQGTHPFGGAGITAAYMTALMGEGCPGVEVASVEVVDAKTYGQEMVSTAGRAMLRVGYAAGGAALPERLVLKIARSDDAVMAPFYANEVAFYRRIRPELSIAAPRCYGGAFDAASASFGLALEDLTVRGAWFPNVTKPVTVEEVRALLETLAALHARFWQSPRFEGDLAWVETHLAGGVAALMNGPATAYIQHEIDSENFKRELVQRLRTTGPELLAGVQAVQRHQAGLPQTLLHGDTHIGNTYFLPDGTGGLLDWQLSVRGYAMHDVSYLVCTALSIGDRRAHDRALLEFYLDRLAAHGLAEVPAFEVAWTEFRRALVWAVYIGWLTTPVVNYGWEINVLNHLRLTTAYEDLGTAGLVAEVM